MRDIVTHCNALATKILRSCVATRYTFTVAKSQNKSIRLPLDQWAEIQRLADTAGVDPSQIIKWAIDAFIRYTQRNGGKIILPVDITQFLKLVSEEPKTGLHLRAAEEPPEFIAQPKQPRKRA